MESIADMSCDSDHIWRRFTATRFESARPCLFLDRDGVVIEERHYLNDPDGVALLPGIAELIAAARERCWAVVVVTNQGGIALGRVSWANLAAIEDRIAADLAALGQQVDGILACPFHPRGADPLCHAEHPMRKPAPGMLLDAAERLNLRLDQSIMLGDKASDMIAAKAAGLPLAVHVATGHGLEERDKALAVADPRADPSFHVLTAAVPGDAVGLLP